MADKPSDREKFHDRMDVRDPERVIGTSADGKPIFLDLRELIASPSDHEERRHKTAESRKDSKIDQLARLALSNAELLVFRVFWKSTDDEGKKLFYDRDVRGLWELMTKGGMEVVQDGLTTVVKGRGKVLETMTFKVEESIREQVARRINEIVRSEV